VLVTDNMIEFVKRVAYPVSSGHWSL
jgi:hypothetical protein